MALDHNPLQLTLADHCSVFTMATVVLSKSRIATLIDEVLNSRALHIIQPNRASSETKSDDVMMTIDNI